MEPSLFTPGMLYSGTISVHSWYDVLWNHLYSLLVCCSLEPSAYWPTSSQFETRHSAMLALALSNTRYMYGIETLASIEDAATLSHRYRSVKVRYCLGEK